MAPDLDLSDRSDSFYWQADRKISKRDLSRLFVNRSTLFDPKVAEKVAEYSTGKRARFSRPPLKFGTINFVTPIVMMDGSTVTVRAHPKGVRNGYFWVESLVSALAREKGIPTYKVVKVDDSRKKFDFDYVVTEYLEGSPIKALWPLSKAREARFVKAQGALAAKLNSIETSGWGFFDNSLAKEGVLRGIHEAWRDHIGAGLNANLRTLVRRKIFSKQAASAVERIFSAALAALKESEPRLIHNDFVDWNLLTDGKKITGVLDWDEAYSGDPVAEIACWRCFFPKERLVNFLKGYRAAAPYKVRLDDKFHLYCLRYGISKLVLRSSMMEADPKPERLEKIKIAKELIAEELDYFGR